MRPIEPAQFSRIMSLPVGERSDLLEFLGATPVTVAQVEYLIGQVVAEHKKHEQARQHSHNI